MFRILKKPLLTGTSLLRRATNLLARFSSSAEQRAAYSPVKKIDFKGKGTMLILSRPEHDPDKSRTIPYQIKESTFKNALGVTVGFMIQFMLTSVIGPYVISAFCVNWVYQITRMTTSLVPEVKITEDGTRTIFKTLLGEEYEFKVEDVQKMKDEKELVETFEEPAMYPVKVEGRVFYMLVEGQEAIKDGEIFRAIINGRRVQF